MIIITVDVPEKSEISKLTRRVGEIKGLEIGIVTDGLMVEC